ncbi:MAG: MarR family transcriptional regulator [Parvularculaceae bacterium]
MKEGEQKFDLDAFTPYRMVVLGRLMSEELGAAYAGEGLSIPEWRVLAVVSQAPAVAARDVAARTPMDKMAVSRAVASLEKKDWIRRSPTADRRVNALELTDEGRAVFDRVAKLALEFEKRIHNALPSGKANGFFEALAILEAALGDARVEAAE